MNTITIDVVSDVVCPWCYLGKARLEKALELTADQVNVQVVWRPFQLDPETPAEGVDHHARLAEKFGGRENVERAHQQIADLGREVGLAYDFDAIKLTPNTLDAHRLLHWAQALGPEVQNRLAALLFKANFEEGQFLGDHTVLTRLAVEAGMEKEVVERLLASDADKDTVREEIEAAQRMGVSGVPCFIVNQKYAISGAQMPETLAGALLSIASENAQPSA
ncbi:DsbA family oxidoreductase [Rhizobium sp. L1K21]|uniref:DsbA family oxidoreductase n=1 Tax=Rhizobium sp. L1K21 TaxID=2954933 RepID=UPI00209387F2|nr:DsbA family oxidoreductase [Rhizobium sp. L1K21]MCO6186050.1 DsbA family oxidoreductase [Rhizobium sp. L1K21]